MPVVTEADRAMLAAVRVDPDAYRRLQNKCRWEAMGLYAVLREWGDPRMWPPSRHRSAQGGEERG